MVADRAPDQPVQPLERLVLVLAEVALGVEEDGVAAAPVGVHPQRRQLGHRAAGQVHRGGEPEERGELRLELGDHPAVAVAVDRRVGRDRRQQVGRGRRPVPGQRAVAGAAEVGEIIHAAQSPVPRRRRAG